MLRVINDVALWIGGNNKSGLDIWFLPGFGESHLCFREVFKHEVSQKARLILFDLPGFGASPAKPEGISIEDCASLWKYLIESISESKNVVLVAHSVAGIIATETAKILDRAPTLIVSVEGNLTKEDAYFSGRALNYNSPIEFYNEFSESVLDLINKGTVPMSYYASLKFADPKTLWTLGRSTINYDKLGEDFKNLECPTLYYWCKETLSSGSKAFLKTNNINNHELVGLGHWPMIKSPERFYSQLLADILANES